MSVRDFVQGLLIWISMYERNYTCTAAGGRKRFSDFTRVCLQSAYEKLNKYYYYSSDWKPNILAN